MEGVATTAVIFWGDSFAAEKLQSKLREQNIKVINGDLEEIPDNASYFFDFGGNSEKWLNLRPNQKLVVICINEDSKVNEWENKLRQINLNWRIVVGENVFGEGMGEESFLGKAFSLAARNKNLILPSLGQFYRVLAVDDLVEAILRACFFSGTSGKVLVIGGREINSKMIAEVLVDEAKMTKTQVIQDETAVEAMDGNLVEAAREVLRWQPEITFKEGAKGTIQYFVAKIDQENRKKAMTKKIEVKPQIERDPPTASHSGGQGRYEVEIEDEEEKEIEMEAETELEPEPELELEPVPGPEPEPEPEKEVEVEEREVEKKEIEEIEEIEDKEVEVEFKLESLRKSPLPERKVEEVKKPADSSAVLAGGQNLLPQPNPSAAKAASPSSTADFRLDKGDNKKKKKYVSYLKWGMWGVGWLLLVVFLVNFIKIVMIPKRIMGTETLIESGKYVEAVKEIDALKKENAKWLGFFDQGKIGTILRAEGDVVDLLDLSLNLVQSGEKISSGLFGEKEIEMKGELNKVSKNLDEAISKMGILQGRLSGQWQWLPGRFREDLNKAKEKLTQERESAERMRKIMPILPEILGLDGKRREYMVLLQNENELRPSGGFIGSYAILSFEGGHFLGFEVKDVYEADGQLKGHVEPPAEIKKYLGEAAWFMRDANWQANFLLVSKDVQWFLDKETGRKVDGVIGLNLASVKSILGVIGEIYVPDFKEKVNQSNLYEQAEYYSETKFFAGSVQKASFLGAVSKQLMEEIKSAKGKEGQALLMAVMDLLDRNEMQVALNEKKAAEVLTTEGWDGSIYEGKCNPPTASQSGGRVCYADYLYIVEANVGVNKANYFLYRNIERQVEIGEKSIVNTLKIVYENTARSNAWPGGDYKNYMRIYIPMGTGIQEVSWSDNASGGKNMVSGEDLKINQVGNKKEIGFLVTVPVGKKISVEVKYMENVDLSALQNFSYLNYMQRQSGFGDTGIVTLISFPDGWQVNAVEPAANMVGGKLLFNQKLDKDIKMGVEISR